MMIIIIINGTSVAIISLQQQNKGARALQRMRDHILAAVELK
jgi:hypothetical protein